MDPAPSTQSTNHRYYFGTEDTWIEQDPKKFAAKLNEVKKELSEIEETQNAIAAKVYSYSAPTRELIHTHSQWNASIQPLVLKVQRCNQLITHFFEELSSLPVRYIKKNLSLVCQLALSLDSIEAKIQRLSLLLSSSTFSQSVITFKAAMESCTEGVNAPLSQEIVKIVEQQQDSASRLNRDLRNQITLLHSQLQPSLRPLQQEPYNNSADTQILLLFDEPLESIVIDQEDHLLDKAIDGFISKSSLKNPENSTKKFLKDKYQEAQSTELRDDLSFCSGALLGLESWGTLIGNPQVVPFVEQLEKIAKWLQKLQQEVQNILLQIYQGTLQNITEDDYNHFFDNLFATSLSVSEQMIQEVRESLYALLSTKQVHTGIYYAARLFAHIEEIRFILDHFVTNLSNPAHESIIKALDNTYKCLSCFEDFPEEDLEVLSLQENFRQLFISPQASPQKNTLFVRKARNDDRKIKTLFFAACSVRDVLYLQNQKQLDLSPFNTRIITCLETIIAKVGTQLKSAAITDKLWLQIVRTAPSSFTIPMQEYIGKEIINWLFFSKKPSHIKLNMALKALSRIPGHKNSPQNKAKSDPDFEQIYELAPNHYEEKVIAIFCDLFFLLHQDHEAQKYNTPYIISHSRMTALLYRAKELTQNLHRDLKEEANELISYVETELKKKINSILESPIEPDLAAVESFRERKPGTSTDSHVLFHLLSQALWLHDDRQKAATELLRHHFAIESEPSLFSLSENEPINYLIALFVINQACLGEKLSPCEAFIDKTIMEVMGEEAFRLPQEFIKPFLVRSKMTD